MIDYIHSFDFLEYFLHCESSFSVCPRDTHCLGMIYYVNFLGGIGSNGFCIKYSAPRTIKKIKILGAILIFSIVLGAEYSLYVKSIATYAPQKVDIIIHS